MGWFAKHFRRTAPEGAGEAADEAGQAPSAEAPVRGRGMSSLERGAEPGNGRSGAREEPRERGEGRREGEDMPPPPPPVMDTFGLPLPRLVLLVGGLLLLFRGWLAAVMPITGDEAYFAIWASHPDWGYYDHPPMVGWWLIPLLKISWSPWLARLPALLLSPAMAAIAGTMVRRAPVEFAKERSWLVALLVLLLPTSVWNVFITTDTPLILFSLLAALAYLDTLHEGISGRRLLARYALAGFWLGLAFLSKYFAVLLGLGILAHTLLARRGEGKWPWIGLALLVLCALPGPLLNLWWNWGHCWDNILFNFLNRHDGSGNGWSLVTPVVYGATLAYLITPFLLVYGWRYRADLRATLAASPVARGAAWLALVPLALFGLLSFVKEVGLHWLLSFVPLLVVVAALALPPQRLRRLSGWLGGFALLHLALILAIAQLPLSTWRHSHLYDGIVLTFHTDALVQRLAPYGDDYVLASDGYSDGAVLGFHARRYFPIFGEGASHARQDDLITDFRALDGRNILVLQKTEPEREAFEPYFRRVETLAFQQDGVTFYLVLGHGFDYDTYRQRVLSRIRERFYRFPSWLPPGRCEFCERYFSEESARP